MATSSSTTTVDPNQAAASVSTAPLKLGATVAEAAPAAGPSTSTNPEPLTLRQHLATLVSPQISSYFIAGGVAGAVSRTVVSPLERLKIIQCVQTNFPKTLPRGGSAGRYAAKSFNSILLLTSNFFYLL